MIHGLLDQLQPDASDDEDEDLPHATFSFTNVNVTHNDQEVTGMRTGEAFAPSNCRLLFICGPGAATAYARGAFPALLPVPWSLDHEQEMPSVRFPVPPKSPRFFVSHKGPEAAAVAMLEGNVPAECANNYAEALLRGFCNASDVLFLDRIFRSGWRVSPGQERPLEPHLCGLWSSAPDTASLAKLDDNIAQLPAPNSLDGLGAALLTLCEAAGSPRCFAALSLQDGAHVGVGCVRAFEQLQPLLEGIGLTADGAQPASYSEVLHKLVPPSSMSIYA